MKTIYIIRHGHAEGKDIQPDHTRNLSEHGKKESKEVGQKLLEQRIRPDLIISSPANRAYQTAQIIAEELNYPVKNIQIEKEIYGDNARDLLAVINGVENQYHSIMLSGHNPSITELAGILDKEFSDDLPTGGLVGMNIDIQSWDELKPGKANTSFTLFPEEA